MTELSTLLTSHLLLFTLVLARVAGIVAVAPLYSSLAVPMQVRIVIALALAVLLTPMQIAADGHLPTSWLDYLVALAGDLLIGLALGLGVALLLAGAQLAGQLMAQVSGLAVAEVFDPALDTNVPVLAEFLHLFTLTIYLLIGGHRWLLDGLLDTFAAMPPGRAHLADSVGATLLTLLTESFSLGLRGAAPVVLALLLATLALGLVSRTLPQLNILAVGFGINTLVTFATLALALGTSAWLFENHIESGIALLVEATSGLGPPTGVGR